jgi:hypothetical protein
MSLLDAPIWQDSGTWIALGVSLLFLLVGLAVHLVIRRVLRAPAPDAP